MKVVSFYYLSTSVCVVAEKASPLPDVPCHHAYIYLPSFKCF